MKPRDPLARPCPTCRAPAGEPCASTRHSRGWERIPTALPAAMPETPIRLGAALKHPHRGRVT